MGTSYTHHWTMPDGSEITTNTATPPPGFQWQGATGAPGLAGSQGVTGLQGAQGAQGATGATGTAGSAGISGGAGVDVRDYTPLNEGLGALPTGGVTPPGVAPVGQVDPASLMGTGQMLPYAMPVLALQTKLPWQR